MSLKAFHIFFIAMSILITLGFAAWVLVGGGVGEQQSSLHLMAVFSGLLGIGLIGYGIHFVRKSRDIII